jgi:hypothetical protein
MRWISLICWMLAMTGCAELRANSQERHDRVAQWFKDWWKTGDSSSNSYQDESDESKAHHEHTIVNTLNGWIGNKSY